MSGSHAVTPLALHAIPLTDAEQRVADECALAFNAVAGFRLAEVVCGSDGDCYLVFSPESRDRLAECLRQWGSTEEAREAARSVAHSLAMVR